MPTYTDVAVPRAAWRMLGLGVAAQAAGTFLVSTPVYLIPLLHERDGLSLSRAGTLAAAPTFGMVLTLVAWGALADRFGERWVIAGGLGLTAVAALVAAPVDDLVLLGVLLALGGAASASTNAASGRVVVGWFPARRRGLAMGVRQVSQPLGVAVAAVVVPPLAARHGTGAPLLLAGVGLLVLALACAAGVRNPPRAARAETTATSNPYRRDGFLWRVHTVSLLLVVPQFTLSTFGLVWLTVGLGWDPTLAGVLVGAAQFVGAVGRIAVGALSDRVGSRVRVLRWVAVAGVLALLALALSGTTHVPLLTGVVLVLATTISVADNGLAFTSVAEAAGTRWSGRALGVQNTGQFLAASAVGPGIGALVPLVGFGGAVALVALAPLAALPLVPRRDAHA